MAHHLQQLPLYPLGPESVFITPWTAQFCLTHSPNYLSAEQSSYFNQRDLEYFSSWHLIYLRLCDNNFTSFIPQTFLWVKYEDFSILKSLEQFSQLWMRRYDFEIKRETTDPRCLIPKPQSVSFPSQPTPAPHSPADVLDLSVPQCV